MIELWCPLYFSCLFLLINAQVPPQDETCDPEWFGRPENQDCKDALARLPDWSMSMSEDEGWEVVREFVNINDSPRILSPDNQDNNVRTPLVYTNDAERYLDYLYNCITDADGNKLCKMEEHAEENEPGWMQFLNDVQIPDPGDPVPKGPKRACSGSCLDLEDCDIASDCLCASTKGILLSSTWGKHSCMHVAGTALALAATAIKPTGVCRGRCLLKEDGTVEIDQLANQTNATSSIDVSIANFTEFLNSSSPLSSAVRNLSISVDKDDYRPERSPSLPLPNRSPHYPPTLVCPCNCTYVSASCCFSHIVWEDPSKQIHMKPPPVNTSVVCDTGSGKWVPKPTAHSTPKDDESGFIGIGSVKWNSSAAGSVKIPKDS